MAAFTDRQGAGNDPLDWLRLIRSRRVGAVTFHRLMAEHGSARAALTALPEIARAAGVESYEICPEGVALAELRSASAYGAKLILWGGAGLPARDDECARRAANSVGQG